MSRSARSIANREAARLEPLELSTAVETLKGMKGAGFDESVDLHVNLNIDPRQAEEQLRATLSLPHGTGRKVRIAVIAEGDDAIAAENAGADLVGSESLVKEIQGGRMDFDVLLAAPTLMRILAPLGRVLGPRGLMPSPKAGTVTTDLGPAVEAFSKGKQSFRNDAGGNIHLRVGKRSFSKEQLVQNVETALSTVMGMRPSAVKGAFIKSVTIASTMGPGIRIAGSW
ncbi:50S ribosomal protein L1 [bacterium]|nr:50S ribosomal protein L1 [bacterium]